MSFFIRFGIGTLTSRNMKNLMDKLRGKSKLDSNYYPNRITLMPMKFGIKLFN